MSEEEKATNPNVQANNNSTAVGKIEVGGSVGGSIVVGGTHIYNYGSPEDTKLPLAPAKIDHQYFEPETILVPEGPFWMAGDPKDSISGYELPRDEISLPAYRIGKYPVTNGQYEEFINQTGRMVTPILGWDGQKVPIGLENNPVMGVTWYDALDYCKWLSNTTLREYSLPNEAQLDKAYQGSYGCSDPVDKIYQWTCTLWGEKGNTPDFKYRLPWRDDGRNNLNVNRQIRRVVCSYPRINDNNLRLCTRTGRFPDDAGLLGARHSFRVVMGL